MMDSHKDNSIERTIEASTGTYVIISKDNKFTIDFESGDRRSGGQTYPFWYEEYGIEQNLVSQLEQIKKEALDVQDRDFIESILIQKRPSFDIKKYKGFF